MGTLAWATLSLPLSTLTLPFPQVGTLACSGFREAISLVRRHAQLAGKKTYTLVMGKPSPAKLANFPEIDVFVMVADPLGFLLDCKAGYGFERGVTVLPLLAPLVGPT